MGFEIAVSWSAHRGQPIVFARGNGGGFEARARIVSNVHKTPQKPLHPFRAASEPYALSTGGPANIT